MSKLTVTTYAPEHRAGVLTLYERTFGAAARRGFERRRRFSSEANLAPDETAAWVLRRNDDGAVLGFLAALPLPYRVRGQRLFANTTADFMVDPSAGFHGIALMRAAFARFPRQVSIDDVQTTKALLGLMKAKPVGEVARWARPLDLRLLKGRVGWVEPVPDALLAAGRPLLRVYDRLRRPRGLRDAVAVDFDARFDRFAEAYFGRDGASVYRDLAWYRWRYGPDSPQAGARAVALLDGAGELEAYAVVACPGDAAWVLEVCGRPGTPLADWQSLLVGALRLARGSGALTLYAPTLVGNVGVEAALRSMGFMQRAHRSAVYVRPAPGDDEVLRAQMLDGPWDVQYGDAEQSHGAVM